MRRLAKSLSVVLHPVFVPTYAILLLLWAFGAQGLSFAATAGVAAVVMTFLLTCIVPAWLIVLLVRIGRLPDIYMTGRAGRLVPYLCSLLSASLWCCYLGFILKMPRIVVWLAAASVLVLLAVTIVNCRWKISAHLSMFGGLIGCVLGYSYYMGLMPWGLWGVLMLLGLLLMYARILLDEHTPAQTVVGFLLGLTLPFLSAVLCP